MEEEKKKKKKEKKKKKKKNKKNVRNVKMGEITSTPIKLVCEVFNGWLPCENVHEDLYTS